LDADKERYDLYQAWAQEHLRPGGLLLADNAYYFGHLLDGTEEAAAVRKMHEKTAEDFDSVCIPTPDGLMLGIKRP
jgi:caffeoyl-CoA O-methyltransferase